MQLALPLPSSLGWRTEAEPRAALGGPSSASSRSCCREDGGSGGGHWRWLENRYGSGQFLAEIPSSTEEMNELVCRLGIRGITWTHHFGSLNDSQTDDQTNGSDGEVRVLGL